MVVDGRSTPARASFSGEKVDDDDRWRSAEHAEAWLARQKEQGDGPGPELSERFWMIARLLPFEPDAELRFADIGAGNGTLGEVLLEAFPRAELVSLDVNPAMIAAGEQRLARFGERSRFVEFDFGSATWPDDAAGPFDAIVSSRAIHHVSDEQKRVIFGWIYHRLRTGGWFLNYDYIRAPTEVLSQTYIRMGGAGPGGHHGASGHQSDAEHGGPDHAGHHSHESSDDRAGEPDGSSGDHHQGHHSHTSPLLGQLSMLEATGFVDVDCFWKQFGSVLYGARRL